MRKTSGVWAYVMVAVAGAILFTSRASATPVTQISILCAQGETGCSDYSGQTNDGTVFTAATNPTQPSTGTGVFQPFLRLKANGIESGFNSDALKPSLDAKPGPWTHSVTMGQFDIMSGGYIGLNLDANQEGKAGSTKNQITLTQLEIFIGPNLTNPAYDQNSNTLSGLSPVWSLDSQKNGDVKVLLQASICDTPGQCGSGKGDMNVYVPVSLLGTFSSTDNFVLYSEFSDGNSGFEEWSFMDPPPTQAPEPATISLFGFGLAALYWARRRSVRRA